MNKINRPIYPFGIERSFHCECCEKTLEFSNLAIAGHYISNESFFICQDCVEDCLAFCKDNKWEFDWNGGLMWDLSIEETDEEMQEYPPVVDFEEQDDYYFEPNYAEEPDDNY